MYYEISKMSKVLANVNRVSCVSTHPFMSGLLPHETSGNLESTTSMCTGYVQCIQNVHKTAVF